MTAPLWASASRSISDHAGRVSGFKVSRTSGSMPAQPRTVRTNFQKPKQGEHAAMKPIEGVITALVTPFTRDGAVDVAALRASVRHQVASGSGGLCPLGGTGEPLSMTVAEHKLVIDTVVEENAGRLPVVIGTL